MIKVATTTFVLAAALATPAAFAQQKMDGMKGMDAPKAAASSAAR